MKRVFLDMDGVCCDFVGGVFNLFGKKLNEEEWPKGAYDIAKVLGVTEGELWTKVDEAGWVFWFNLREYPWFKALYDSLTKWSDGELYFLTSPSKHASCLAGKREWLSKRLGKMFDKVIYTKHKHLLAGSETYLIDDSDKNVDEFRAAGGSALLFPMPWNKADEPTNHVKYVMDWIREEGS
jgi:5'(3')-deoxyribonucleotidase